MRSDREDKVWPQCLSRYTQDGYKEYEEEYLFVDWPPVYSFPNYPSFECQVLMQLPSRFMYSTIRNTTHPLQKLP